MTIIIRTIIQIPVQKKTNKQTWYKDGDGDGFGIATDTKSECTKPSGYADKAGDCDDDNPNAHEYNSCGICAANPENPEINNNKVFQLAQAGLGILGGTLEVVAGIFGEGVTLGASTVLVVDGAFRVTQNARKAIAIYNDEPGAENSPTNLGQYVGQIVDYSGPTYDENGDLNRGWQNALGGADDFLAAVFSGGVSNPLSGTLLAFLNGNPAGALRPLTGGALLLNDLFNYGGVYDKMNDCNE